jgi:hypothetical protein
MKSTAAARLARSLRENWIFYSYSFHLSAWVSQNRRFWSGGSRGFSRMRRIKANSRANPQRLRKSAAAAARISNVSI